MKKSIRLFLMVPTVALLMAAVCYLSFKAIEQSIIEENEALVHNMAQSLLPMLLVGDTQRVERLLKTLEKHPGIQTAELISGAGVSLASYVRDGAGIDPSQTQFALASADEALGLNGLHVVAPLTFDTQILANLHIAVNVWPAYLHIIQWLVLLLIIPSALCVAVKQMRLKVRFEKSLGVTGAGYGGSFDIQHALQDALQDSDISLEYHPIQRVTDKGIFGAEVVICWKHPSGQTLHVSPADFITLAENSGLFLPFSHWVLETACKQFAAWQHQHGPLVMALNITPSQLKDEHFCYKVRHACELGQFPHQLIEFEINEAVLLRSPTVMADVDLFVQRGMSLTVDNFGLSTRSHDLLQNASIRKIKFASLFIKNVETDADMLAHVQSFARLALEHDVQITADGLHSATQTELMQQMGCVLGQGSYLSDVLPAVHFESLLVTQMRDTFAQPQSMKQDLSVAALGY